MAIHPCGLITCFGAFVIGSGTILPNQHNYRMPDSGVQPVPEGIFGLPKF